MVHHKLFPAPSEGPKRTAPKINSLQPTMKVSAFISDSRRAAPSSDNGRDTYLVGHEWLWAANLNSLPCFESSLHACCVKRLLLDGHKMFDKEQLTKNTVFPSFTSSKMQHLRRQLQKQFDTFL
ncbi:hypothetical protein JTE90_028329 [Oedothorax gibbosus]|uniref:Uncharacterized protein n=1 Tax=Oedothorax gibbosus TaxID=931172 RepID=A0AAV6V466_9ARAC|nr:hypothetical protein JTE90_028329 [Oedothorax gibbosus]